MILKLKNKCSLLPCNPHEGFTVASSRGSPVASGSQAATAVFGYSFFPISNPHPIPTPQIYSSGRINTYVIKKLKEREKDGICGESSQIKRHNLCLSTVWMATVIV
jgi:hypothetical protein